MLLFLQSQTAHYAASLTPPSPLVGRSVGPSLLKFVCNIIAALAAKLACIGNYVLRAGFYTACDYTEMTVIFGCVLRGVIVGFGGGTRP